MPRNVMGARGEVGRRKKPARSANATRAHATGDVTWVIDLAQPVQARVAESVDPSRRYALSGLLLLAIALWTFNLTTLVMHAG